MNEQKKLEARRRRWADAEEAFAYVTLTDKNGNVVWDGEKQGQRQPVRYEVRHSPKGGVTINGTFYPGGEFIPAGEIAQATPEEKKNLERAEGKAGGGTAAKPAKEKAPASPAEGGTSSGWVGDGGQTGAKKPKKKVPHEYNPDVTADVNGDGVADAARVGVPAMQVPPPPPVGRLPNLDRRSRMAESAFRRDFHADPDGAASRYLQYVQKGTKPGDPLKFETDEAKMLVDSWAGENIPLEKRAENRATLNLALHQTANAIAKRAFLQAMDIVPKGSEILVTVGGCGAGKGFALKQVPQALEMKARSALVWDSAGDQNATENPWIQQEAEKRGLKVNYVFVHADPYTQWSDPERGVVHRAGNPDDGRMVDARVFADSYVMGARNHQAFYEKNKNNPSASFVFLDNRGKPELMSGIPPEMLKLDADDLAAYADRTVRESQAPDRIKRGATMGAEIWKKEN